MNAFDPADWGVVVAVVGGLLAGLLYLIRGEVIRSQNRIVEQIQSKTLQIQPGANGGESLADLHKSLDHFIHRFEVHVCEDSDLGDYLKAKIDVLSKRQVDISERVTGLWDAVVLFETELSDKEEGEKNV